MGRPSACSWQSSSSTERRSSPFGSSIPTGLIQYRHAHRRRRSHHASVRLAGKVAVVIGAAQGIGHGIVERFASEGAMVGIGDPKEVEGRALLGSIGEERAIFERTDASDEPDVARLVAATVDRFGRLDILVQNAGIFPLSLIETTTAELWDRMLRVNLKGTFFAAKACAAPMRASGGGRMVFTSSITGPRVAVPGVGAYAASEGGINAFIKVAALEFARYGITVNGVEPGTFSRKVLRTYVARPSCREWPRRSRWHGSARLTTWPELLCFLRRMTPPTSQVQTIVVDGGQILPRSEDALSEEAWQ